MGKGFFDARAKIQRQLSHRHPYGDVPRFPAPPWTRRRGCSLLDAPCAALYNRSPETERCSSWLHAYAPGEANGPPGYSLSALHPGHGKTPIRSSLLGLLPLMGVASVSRFHWKNMGLPSLSCRTPFASNCSRRISVRNHSGISAISKSRLPRVTPGHRRVVSSVYGCRHC